MSTAFPGTAIALALLCCGCLPLADERRDSSEKKAEVSTPQVFRAKGRLVCLAEEMKRLHKAAVAPVHDHIVGFRVDERRPAGAPRYYTILHTLQSKALFVDKRFQDRELLLIGRTFPGTTVLEVSGWRWYEKGRALDVYYWCDVCSIRTVDPGSCACCQADVELRTEPARQEKAR